MITNILILNIHKCDTNKETNKPSFVIGLVKGSRTMILWDFVDECKKKYGIVNKRGFFTVLYPIEDARAINEAYRLGLAASAAQYTTDMELAEYAVAYIMNIKSEEVWFWTSKLLAVIGDKLDSYRVLNSLYVLSGAKKI